MPVSPRWARFIRYLRLFALALLAVAALILLLLVIHRGLLPILAWFMPHLETRFYDLAVYGVYRTQSYVSFPLKSPLVNILRWDDVCNSGHVFVAPYGDSVPVPGPTILDPLGGLIWASDKFGQITNFQMQVYHNETYLTFWAGHKDGGVGEGALFMLDSTYRVARKVHAVGDGLKGDLHEFQITDQGTAFFTIYNATTFDLRPLGLFRGKNGWIRDCIFQEVDIETGELLFQWVASEHLQPERSYYTQPFAGFVSSIAFDYFHMNSIAKDRKGNYLISSRHFHTLTYIDGTSGDILWELGGDSHDFTDLSNGAASDFKWQHHARWLSEEEGLVSFFDNGMAGPLHVDSPTSKGTILRLDTNNMTATHVRSFYATANVGSSSQGSVQLLPDHHIFIGWGSSGMWTEHNRHESEPLCEVHFSAAIMYPWEWVKSYRVFKAWGWVGRPAVPPTAVIHGSALYVSWNGATEVRHWQLLARPAGARSDDEYEIVAEIDKLAFEESFPLPSGDPQRQISYSHYRVRALDASRSFLADSNTVLAPADSSMTRPGWAAFWLFSATCLILAIGMVFIRRRRGKHMTGLALYGGPPGSATAGETLRSAWEPAKALLSFRWAGTGDGVRYTRL